MAVKTIEVYAAARTTQLAAATRLDFTGIVIVCPEVTGRTFRSVIVEVTVHDNVSVAASMTSWLIGIKLGAVAFNDVTTTVTLPNSGDNTSFQFTRDVTSYFVTNFAAGTNDVAQVGVQFGGVATLPITVKLIITYEYTDSFSVLDSGTATSGNVNNMTDSTKSWTTDQFKYHYVKITGGTGSGQVRPIASNTATIISVSPVFSTGPDATSTYQIVPACIKTARFPIESGTAQLTNTLAELGTNQVPDVEALLPEANPTMVGVWFVSEYNNGGNSTTDFGLELSLDAEAGVSRGTIDMGLNSADWGMDVWDRINMDVTVAHAFKARSNNVTSRFSLLAPMLVVYYTYNILDTTRVLQSLVLPIDAGAGVAGTSTHNMRKTIELMIEEPGTITMVQSGLLLRCYDSSTVVMNVSVGAQSARAYTLTTGSVQVGPYTLMHRIDSGGAQGAALTLARGKNEIVVNFYANSGGTGFAASGLLYLNYTSDIHADGEGVHNHSTCWSICEMDNTLAVYRVTAPSRLFNIPESNWYLNALGYVITGWLSSTIVSPLTLDCMILSGETPPGDGFAQIVNAGKRDDGEASVHLFVGDGTALFKHSSGDPAPQRLALETTRDYRLTSNTAIWGVMAWLTKHSITFGVAGNITGYTGDGSGIAVDVFRTDTKERILALTSIAGGSYTGTWFDNTINLSADARQDSTHVGRSDNGAAT